MSRRVSVEVVRRPPDRSEFVSPNACSMARSIRPGTAPASANSCREISGRLRSASSRRSCQEVDAETRPLRLPVGLVGRRIPRKPWRVRPWAQGSRAERSCGDQGTRAGCSVAHRLERGRGDPRRPLRTKAVSSMPSKPQGCSQANMASTGNARRAAPRARPFHPGASPSVTANTIMGLPGALKPASRLPSASAVPPSNRASRGSSRESGTQVTCAKRPLALARRTRSRTASRQGASWPARSSRKMRVVVGSSAGFSAITSSPPEAAMFSRVWSRSS